LRRDSSKARLAIDFAKIDLFFQLTITMLTLALTVLLGSTGYAAAPASTCQVVLPADIQQGALVLGHAALGTRLSYAGQVLKQSADGRFVFGVAFNAAKIATLSATGKNCSATLRFPVIQRSYRTERVNGVPQNTVTPDPETAKRIALEAAMIQKARSLDSDALYWQQPFQWPAIGRESGVYGSQRILNGTPGSPHLGLDMAAPVGTPVKAALPGKVTLLHEDMIMTGKTLLLDHGFGISTIYIHLSEIAVKTGDLVQAGQRIGAIGSTGRSSGPHLHFQVQWFQEKLDPALVLPVKK
jgi:murein DD-endopeptidase MepM/ murein hydrolase activator NlpD